MHLKRKLAAAVAVMSIAALGGGVAATPASAVGPGVFVIPAGGTATFSGATFSACNALSWGYNLNSGADTVVPPSKPVGCNFSFPGGNPTIGPVASTTILRVFLRDDSCAITYYSDGTSSPTPPTDHVLVTPEGPGAFLLKFADAGIAPGCLAKHLPRTDENLKVKLNISLRSTSTSVNCEPQLVVAGNSTTCTATVTDTTSSGQTTPTGMVSFVTSGPGSFNKTSCKLISASASSASCSVTYTPGSTPAQPVRSDTITAEYEGDSTHAKSKGTTTVEVISPTALAHGSFTIGDENAKLGNVVSWSNTEVEWWGSNWWKENSLSGGPAPPAFKGFAETSPSPPTCGETWTTDTGNSSGPPATVPGYMEVIAASKITQSGSTISGNAPEVVVVKTNPGYLPDPGHKGTGTVVAIVCKT